MSENKDAQHLTPNEYSERIVIDEIFDGRVARILRAPRLPGINTSELLIDTWGEEKEDFLDVWRLEAFVGFTSMHFLKEGDIFFIFDGRRLTNDYKPIPRIEAKHMHLLLSWDDSRQLARQEIKKEFYKLAAAKMTDHESSRNILMGKVDKKFANDRK